MPQRVLLLVACLAFVLTGCAAGPAPASSPPPSCSEAESWLTRGLLDRAREEWVRVLAVSPPLSCPVDVGGEVATRRARATENYEKGRVLAKSNPDAAARAFTAALQDDPAFEDARSGLLSLAEKPSGDDPYAGVLRLDELGERDEARKKLLEAAADAPVPPDVADRFGLPEPLGFLAALQGPWFDALTSPWVLAALILLLIFVGRGISRRTRTPVLDVGEFVAGASGAKMEPAVPTLIENGLARFQREAGRSIIDLVIGPPTLEEFPADVKSAVPASGLVSSVVRYILPRDLISLTGAVLTSKTDGAGFAMTLNREGRIIASEVLWQRAFDPEYTPGAAESADAISALAGPASVWLRYQVENSGSPKRPFAPLGARRWKSYALQAAGVDRRVRKQNDLARKLFLDSVDVDPRNRGAAFNLALLDSEAAKTLADQEDAIRRLKDVQAASRIDTGSRRQPDPLWYQATYWLAAAYSYAGDLAPQEARHELYNKGTQELDTLRANLGSRQLQRSEPAVTQQTVDKLRPIEPLVRAGLLASLGDVASARKVLSDNPIEPGDREAQYALACCRSILSARVPKAQQSTELQLSLNALKLALLPGEADGARSDPSLKAVRESESVLASGKTARSEFERILQAISPATPPRNPIHQLLARLGWS